MSAIAITYPIGTAAGVYIVGSIGDESGSFWATLGGSYIGGIIGAITLFSGLEANLSGWAFKSCLVAAALAAPIGATIAFNRTRKSEKPLASGAPPVSFSVNLARMRF